MCVTTLIATNQIVVLNFSLRSPSTHTMSQTIKHVSGSSSSPDRPPQGCHLYWYSENCWCVPVFFNTRLSAGVPGIGTSLAVHAPTGGWGGGHSGGERHQGAAAQLLRADAESRGIRPETTSQWNDVWQTEREARSNALYWWVLAFILRRPPSCSWVAAAVTHLSVTVSWPLVDNIDVTSTANLYKSLAQAAPEIKQCVDACNFIADSIRQQNTIGSVSDDEKWWANSLWYFHCIFRQFVFLILKSLFFFH